MRWGNLTPKARAFDVRYVWRFALFPAKDVASGTWVWLERYARAEYWSDIQNAWEPAWLNYPLESHHCVYDCRTEVTP